jgi:nuclear GTP-binding protein
MAKSSRDAGNTKRTVKDRVKSGNHSLNSDRTTAKGGQNQRTKATIDRLKMYKNQKARRNVDGKIVKAAPFQGWNSAGTRARIEPNRKWFGNSRVITQNALQKFQDEMKIAKSDPYKLIIKPTNLPTTILNETAKVN